MWSGSIGGLERYVLDISTVMKRHGLRPEVCILNKAGLISDILRENNILVHHIGMKSGFNVIGAVRFAQVLLNGRYDIIHVHDRHFLSTIILACFCRAPKIFTEHGGELLGNKPWKRFLFYKILSFQYDGVIANSNYVKSVLLQKKLISKDRVAVIYNGIDLERFQVHFNKTEIRKQFKIPKDSTVIGMVARLIPRKGVDFFVKIAHEIYSLDKKNKYVFLVIGDGPERHKYDKITTPERDSSDLRFLGWQINVDRVMSIFDIYLFTSRWEPFGLVLAEAMAMGVPIVGFDIKGANEIAEDKKTALLSPPFDTHRVAANVIALISNDELYKKLSAAAITRTKNLFSLKQNYNRVYELYKEILTKKGLI